MLIFYKPPSISTLKLLSNLQSFNTMNDLQMIYYSSKRALQITNCIIGNLTLIFGKLVWYVCSVYVILLSQFFIFDLCQIPVFSNYRLFQFKHYSFRNTLIVNATLTQPCCHYMNGNYYYGWQFCSNIYHIWHDMLLYRIFNIATYSQKHITH